MRKEGMVSGIPDLFIAFPQSGDIEAPCEHTSAFVLGMVCGGLFIEMKRSDSEKTTANQDYYLQKLQEAGYKTAICHSFDEFVSTVNDYLK